MLELSGDAAEVERLRATLAERERELEAANLAADEYAAIVGRLVAVLEEIKQVLGQIGPEEVLDQDRSVEEGRRWVLSHEHGLALAGVYRRVSDALSPDTAHGQSTSRDRSLRHDLYMAGRARRMRARKMRARAETAERQLAQCVEALERLYGVCLNDVPCPVHEDACVTCSDAYVRARAALAQVEGEGTDE